MTSDAAHWNERYASGTTPWDTGIVPPEVEAFWQEHHTHCTPGDAVLDLGCGTLTNLRFLARQGMWAIGLDLSSRALRRGRHRLFQSRDEGHHIDVMVGDVSRLPLLDNLVRYALDLGCLHCLAQPVRTRYVEELCRVLQPGSYYHLFGFQRLAAPGPDEREFFMPGEFQTLLDPWFETVSEQVDEEPQDGRVGVWRLMRRP